MQTEQSAQWHIIGASVTGTSHTRINSSNQDAIDWIPKSHASDDKTVLIVAVSDGHGGAKYIRSGEGARIAVDSALSVLREFLNSMRVEDQAQPLSLSAIKRLAEERLPQNLIRSWSETVLKHHAEHPFTSDEITAITKRDSTADAQLVRDNPLVAYGATLLIVAMTHTCILYLQLGDGDIVTVSQTGEASKPLPRDPRLFANETTSLCTKHAWRDVRFRFQPLLDIPLEQIPALILLSTDGYSNSFSDEAAFLQVGPDILQMLRSEGIEPVQRNLKSWLQQASQEGSGDDVSLGIVCRADCIGQPDEASDKEKTSPFLSVVSERPLGEAQPSEAVETEGVVVEAAHLTEETASLVEETPFLMEEPAPQTEEAAPEAEATASQEEEPISQVEEAAVQQEEVPQSEETALQTEEPAS